MTYAEQRAAAQRKAMGELVARTKGVTVIDGNPYRVGHHGTAGFYVQTVEPKRSGGAHWVGARHFSYSHNKADVERWLARAAEVGFQQAHRDYYEERDTAWREEARRKEAAQVAVTANAAAPLLALDAAARRVVLDFLAYHHGADYATRNGVADLLKASLEGASS